ncbi:MAG: chemotaxis protein CheW [Bryobacteraceae bacterium]|nr:MAG: chemotaxis protein CheW [Bryobacteraceae bacterium]
MESPGTTTRSGRYLIFRLGASKLVLPIPWLRQIIGIREIVALPRLPQGWLGAIFPRDIIMPVLDLRVRLGLPPADVHARPGILLVEADKFDRSRGARLLADEVSEVIAWEEQNTEDALQASAAASQCLSGVAQARGVVCLLPDLDALLGWSALARVKSPLPTESSL